MKCDFSHQRGRNNLGSADPARKLPPRVSMREMGSLSPSQEGSGRRVSRNPRAGVISPRGRVRIAGDNSLRVTQRRPELGPRHDRSPRARRAHVWDYQQSGSDQLSNFALGRSRRMSRGATRWFAVRPGHLSNICRINILWMLDQKAASETPMWS